MIGISYFITVFTIMFQCRKLITFLKCTLSILTKITCTTDKNHRPSISPRISNSCYSMYYSWSTYTKAYAWFTLNYNYWKNYQLKNRLLMQNNYFLIHFYNHNTLYPLLIELILVQLQVLLQFRNNTLILKKLEILPQFHFLTL